jgi:hypothetical protein
LKLQYSYIVSESREKEVQDSGFRILGSGFWVLGSRFRIMGSRFWVQGSRFWVQGSGFKDSGFSPAARWPRASSQIYKETLKKRITNIESSSGGL